MSQRHLPGWEPTKPEAHGYWQASQRKRRSWLWWVGAGCAGLIGLGVLGFVGLVVLGLVVGPPKPVPTTSTTIAAACQPQPCATLNGVTLQVSNLNRNYVPADVPPYAKNQANPPPGFHFVRLEVTFVGISGEHEVSANSVQLVDPLGYQQAGLALLVSPSCNAGEYSAALAAGGKLGPIPLCFQAGGSVSGPLKVVWIPSALTGPQPGVRIDLH